MSMIGCYVIDDEPSAIKILKTFIDETSGLELIGSNLNPIEALDVLFNNKTNIDILFVDIRMPQISGIHLAELVKSRMHVVVTTAYQEHGFEAFKADVCDYLLKPILYENFLHAVTKVKLLLSIQDKKNESNGYYFYVKSDNKGKLVKINYSEITFVECYKNYITIHSIGEKHTSNISLKQIEEHLSGQNFLRVHKSYIANLDKIKYIEGNQIVFQDQTKITLGATYKHDILEKIGEQLLTNKIRKLS